MNKHTHSICTCVCAIHKIPQRVEMNAINSCAPCTRITLKRSHEPTNGYKRMHIYLALEMANTLTHPSTQHAQRAPQPPPPPPRSDRVCVCTKAGRHQCHQSWRGCGETCAVAFVGMHFSIFTHELGPVCQRLDFDLLPAAVYLFT